MKRKHELIVQNLCYSRTACGDGDNPQRARDRRSFQSDISLTQLWSGYAVAFLVETIPGLSRVSRIQEVIAFAKDIVALGGADS